MNFLYTTIDDGVSLCFQNRYVLIIYYLTLLNEIFLYTTIDDGVSLCFQNRYVLRICYLIIIILIYFIYYY
jgi:hypothetical protein